MIFTQEQINEIKQRLALSGSKDLQFPLAELPLTGEEVIAIVQNGKNKRVSIEEFYEEFSQYIDGSERVDFFNVSRYAQRIADADNSIALTLAEAVELCPEDVKRGGQVITFVGNEGNWAIWQYKGTTPENWNDTETSWVNLDYNPNIVDVVTSEETEISVESLEEGLMQQALRKTPQILSEAEKTQARENIGAVSASEAVCVNKQNFNGTEKAQARKNIDAITASEAEQIAEDKIYETSVSSPEKLQTIQELAAWMESNPDSAATMNLQIQENAEKNAEQDEKLTELESKVLSNDIITITEKDFTIKGMYSSSDGAYSANNNRLLTPFIRVNAGDELSVFKIQQGTEQLALIAFDSEKNILLDKCKAGRWIYESYNYEIDDEVVYLRFGRTLDTECAIQNSLSRSIHEYIPSKIKELSQDTVTNNNYIKRVEKSVALVNLVDNVEEGKCINSEGNIVNATAAYKVSKFHAKGGMCSIKSSKPGTQRALWMYADDTYATPKLELFGNTSIDCNIALSEGYYAIGWHGDESALVIPTENINTLDSVDSYVITPSMGTENVRLYLDNGVFTEVANNYRVCTGYIPVFKGQRLIRSNYKAESEYNIAFYSSPSFDGFTRIVTASNQMMPVVEENEHYIRICCSPSDTKTTTITTKKDSYAERHLGLDSAISKVGNDMASKHVDTLSNAELLFDNFPNGLKKGHTFSLFGKVVEFSQVSIGFGKWGPYTSHIEVDNDNVYLAQKDSTVKTIKHNLTITEFIKVISSSGNDGVLNIIVSTLGGVFKTEIPEWGYGINGTPFVSADSSTTLTDVIVSFGNKDFGKSVWCFGDSYYHVDIDAGVMRWLKEYGVFDNILVMGYGGCDAAHAYDDFVKCLSYGMPKYVIWSEGMNDNYGTWLPYYNKVVEVCANKGIELILQTIPKVRHSSYIEKDAISSIVKNSGYRYIDAAKAVGANSKGEWYGNGSSNDYQSTDNVHPTALGAKAIATQWLVDFHEIMQY